jgi:hypothetical protein
MRRDLGMTVVFALLACGGAARADGFGGNATCPSCGGGGYASGGYGYGGYGYGYSGYASYGSGYVVGVPAYAPYPAYFGFNSPVTYPAYGFDAFHGYTTAAVGAPFVPQYEYPAGTYGPYGPSWTAPAYWYGR